MTFRDGLARSAALYAEFLGRFLIALVVLLTGLNAVVVLVSGSGGPGFVRGFLVCLATTIGTAWGQATMVEDVRDRRQGKGDASVPELFGRTWRIAPRVAWATSRISLATGAIFFIGFVAGVAFVALAVFYIAVRWSLAVPVLVIEGTDTPAAFGRSTMLVDPYIWQVLGVFFVALATAGVVDVVLGVAIADALDGWLELWLSGIVDGLLFRAVSFSVSTALYYELSTSDPVSDANRVTRPPTLERRDQSPRSLRNASKLALCWSTTTCTCAGPTIRRSGPIRPIAPRSTSNRPGERGSTRSGSATTSTTSSRASASGRFPGCLSAAATTSTTMWQLSSRRSGAACR